MMPQIVVINLPELWGLWSLIDASSCSATGPAIWSPTNRGCGLQDQEDPAGYYSILGSLSPGWATSSVDVNQSSRSGHGRLGLVRVRCGGVSCSFWRSRNEPVPS